MPSPLKYRPPYVAKKVAPWVSGLGARSGAYVIKDARTGQILYVGESHSGRLRKTLLRHFQAWTGRTAGKTYNPERVVVALRFCPPSAAVSCQNNLICRLRPRDNEALPAECADEPF
jgi:hypothetical protein